MTRAAHSLPHRVSESMSEMDWWMNEWMDGYIADASCNGPFPEAAPVAAVPFPSSIPFSQVLSTCVILGVHPPPPLHSGLSQASSWSSYHRSGSVPESEICSKRKNVSRLFFHQVFRSRWNTDLVLPRSVVSFSKCALQAMARYHVRYQSFASG